MQRIVVIGNEAESISCSLIFGYGLLNRSDLSKHVHANRNKRLLLRSRTKPYCLGCASSSIRFHRKVSQSEGPQKRTILDGSRCCGLLGNPADFGLYRSEGLAELCQPNVFIEPKVLQNDDPWNIDSLIRMWICQKR